MTEPPVPPPPPDADAFLKGLFTGSLAIPSREEILAKLRACGDPRAAAIIKDIETDAAQQADQKPTEVIHPSGFRLLKGGKE